jgi:hypothetical protein
MMDSSECREQGKQKVLMAGGFASHLLYVDLEYFRTY